MSRRTMQRFYDELVNEGHLDVADEIMSSELVDHESATGEPEGVEDIKDFFAGLRHAFPDLRATIEDLLEADDKCVARVRYVGTHKREFWGLPPTGKRIDIESIDIVRFDGGKVVEHWGVTDRLRMMEQLGVVPPPPA